MNFDLEDKIEVCCCVVIVTFNGVKWIENCLNSIFKSTIDITVIIVDNNSSDGTLDLIRKKFHQVQILKNHKNIGFGNANNKGLKYAFSLGCENFLLLNQDTTVEPKTIEILVSSANRNSEYAVLSPIHLNGEGIKIDSKFKTYLRGRKGRRFLEKLKNGGSNEEILPITFVNAAAWMITRKNLCRIGLFHPLFFHYGEDNNYCQRIIHSGLKVGVTDATAICHDRAESKSPISVNPRLVFERAVLGDVLNPFRFKIRLIRIFPAMYHAVFLSKDLSLKNRIKYLGWAWNTFNNIFDLAQEYDQSELFVFEDQDK